MAGGPIGLSTSGGFEQARVIAERALRAIVDADEDTLQSLLAERLARTQPRISRPAQTRSQMLQHLLDPRLRTTLHPGAALDALLDVRESEAKTLREVYAGRPLPTDLSPDDILLRIPMTDLGNVAFRRLMHWGVFATVLVRPGASPQIIGL